MRNPSEHGLGQRRNGEWIVTQDRREALCTGHPGEGAAPGQHLVQHAAQREDIAGRLGGLAPRLLRRHVTKRAEDGAGRIAAMRAPEPSPVAGTEGDPREAEVEDLDPAVAGEEDVLRLEVAVDDALGVRRRQAVREGGPDLDGLAQGRAPLLRRRRDVSPSSSSMTAKAMPCSVPQSWMARMFGWDRAATALASRSKSAPPLGVVGERRRQHLDGDLPLEPRVPGG